MTIAQAVWDGPEVLVDENGRFGLIDFGACATRPVVHAMANRSLHFGLEENAQTRRFVELYLRYYPLTQAELAGVPIFRKVSIAIYCLYQLSRLGGVELTEEKREQIQAYVDRHAGLLA